jgi:superfamily II DNA or RNA helicase
MVQATWRVICSGLAQVTTATVKSEHERLLAGRPGDLLVVGGTAAAPTDDDAIAHDQPVAASGLEVGALHLPMSERLLLAAGRLEHANEEMGRHALRPDQRAVFEDAALYLQDIATRPVRERKPPFARIVQPPRTGKTVIAAHLVARSGLVAAFIVPTRSLVEQTVREMLEHAVDVPVGRYYGEGKDVVEHGVNVLTYAMLERAFAAGCIPAAIRRAALVLVDEGHHAMTAGRMNVLARAFSRSAIRLALTATPDYSAERQLRHFFPDLVHEIDLEEALALELLAPLRVWVAEIDIDGSSVRFMAGDFEQETIGRLLATAPAFRAVEIFRYAGSNRRRAALIACASRQQAHDLARYLDGHRPDGAPPPAIILGDTPREERESILARFESGDIDTLVQVGVLLEGWTSPRCKLLLDLSPSLSHVRATQKYFRVMTRDGEAEARIYILLPRDLPYLPVLPMELFGRSTGEYACGDLVTKPGGSPAPVKRSSHTPVAGVRVKQRIVLAAGLEKPALDPRNDDEVRAVIGSCAAFDPGKPVGPRSFRWLLFDHPLFRGRGEFLLRLLGVPPTRAHYDALLARLYPAEIEAALTETLGVEDREEWCSHDREHLERSIAASGSRTGRPEEPYWSSWRALCGSEPEPSCTPEHVLLARAARMEIRALFEDLTRRQQWVVTRYLGLDGQEPLTTRKLALQMTVSSARTSQILRKALGTLRDRLEVLEKRRSWPGGDRSLLWRCRPGTL